MARAVATKEESLPAPLQHAASMLGSLFRSTTSIPRATGSSSEPATPTPVLRSSEPELMLLAFDEHTAAQTLQRIVRGRLARAFMSVQMGRREGEGGKGDDGSSSNKGPADSGVVTTSGQTAKSVPERMLAADRQHSAVILQKLARGHSVRISRRPRNDGETARSGGSARSVEVTNSHGSHFNGADGAAGSSPAIDSDSEGDEATTPTGAVVPPMGFVLEWWGRPRRGALSTASLFVTYACWPADAILFSSNGTFAGLPSAADAIAAAAAAAATPPSPSPPAHPPRPPLTARSDISEARRGGGGGGGGGSCGCGLG